MNHFRHLIGVTSAQNMSSAITVIHYLNVVVEPEAAFVSTFTFDRVAVFAKHLLLIRPLFNNTERAKEIHGSCYNMKLILNYVFSSISYNVRRQFKENAVGNSRSR